ncbi:MAG TPA: hypothetical protein ENK06_06435 [Gammaproteobacteria bacterium]|nr:hypothetical protein [Gammaproteobacteria bacterium]
MKKPEKMHYYPSIFFKTSSLLVLLAFIINAPAMAAFASGGDGSLGALNVTTDTVLDMPEDGIFRYTTINIAAETTLTFNKNANNTPVYLLTTGDVTINGVIDISGKQGGPTLGGEGGPGGFNGGKAGNPGIAGSEPSDGYGPGGGRRAAVNAAGGGSYATKGRAANSGAVAREVYGSQLLIPLVGGSGGGGGSSVYGGGGGGGGAILIASNTKIQLNGAIFATGGKSGINPSAWGAGSGGAIRLVAPDVTGTGIFNAEGENSTNGRGRVRVDMYLTGNTAFNLQCAGSVFPSTSCTVGSFMKTFLDNAPSLQITEVAGNAVTRNGQYFELPFDSVASQPISIRSSNFSRDITVRVKLTPVSGDPIIQDFLLRKGAGAVQDDIVNMDFPLNTSVRVNAWTIPTPAPAP